MADHNTGVLVIGAGPTGIGAAVHLQERGIDHLVVDVADRVGGMAASHTDDHGFTWDLGGHVIHSHFREFDDAVSRSHVPLRAVARNGAVWMSGADSSAFVPTPVQAQMTVWPTDLEPLKPAANLAEYYRNTFGRVLTDCFFTGYNEKMWTLPLHQIDHTWTSLRSGGSGRNVPQMGLAKDFCPSTETFPYPVGGSGALWSAIVDTLTAPGAIRLGCGVERIEPEHHRALLSNGETVEYDYCISSAPVTWLLDSLHRQTDSGCLHASTQLAIGLGFAGAPPEILADKSWIYCPDKSVPWFRATMLSNYDPLNAGEGRWNVLLEVTSANGTFPDAEKAIHDCIDGFVGMGADPESIESVWTYRIQRGYPIPTLGRDAILAAADHDLKSLNIYSRGRFGGWRYESCNQDYSYMQGRQAVGAICDGSPEDVYWHPEQF